MNIQDQIDKKNHLLEIRKDQINLIIDLERVISKQENLVNFGVISEEKAQDNIKKFEGYIIHHLNEIERIESEQVTKFHIVLGEKNKG